VPSSPGLREGGEGVTIAEEDDRGIRRGHTSTRLPTVAGTKSDGEHPCRSDRETH
jgi:hypothetical protein